MGLRTHWFFYDVIRVRLAGFSEGPAHLVHLQLPQDLYQACYLDVCQLGFLPTLLLFTPVRDKAVLGFIEEHVLICSEQVSNPAKQLQPGTPKHTYV